MAPNECRAYTYGSECGAGEDGEAEAAEKRQLQSAEITSHKHALLRWRGQYTGCRRAGWRAPHPSTA
jgi:hypothetical protein